MKSICSFLSLSIGLSALLLMTLFGCEKNEAFNKPDNQTKYPATLTDIDGNTYHTVKIGDQLWLQENLRTTRYNDGVEIPLIQDSITWISTTENGYCWYNNDNKHKNDYGALYNWFVVDKDKLCPAGWRIPTRDDFNKLIASQGGTVFAGEKLKEKGFLHWDNQNIKANNESGFTALPGGYRHGSNGCFSNLGNFSGWWTSDDYAMKQFAWFMGLYSQFSTVEINYYNVKYGFSVRCIQK